MIYESMGKLILQALILLLGLSHCLLEPLQLFQENLLLPFVLLEPLLQLSD